MKRNEATSPAIRSVTGVSVDDANDNHLHEPVGRLPEIEEDEPPYRLLVGDYGRFVGSAPSS